MIGRLGGCLSRLVLFVIVVTGGVLAWQKRDEIEEVWSALRDWREASNQPSPELADAAQTKLTALTGGRRPERVTLSQAEVQSLVRYRLAAVLPPFVVAPEVEIRGDKLHIRAQVPTDRLPLEAAGLDVQELLPDTAQVSATAQLIPLDGERVGLAVDELAAARIPLPRAMIPAVLRRLGRSDEPGLPPDALAVPLPAGAGGAYIRAGRIVIVPRSQGSRQDP